MCACTQVCIHVSVSVCECMHVNVRTCVCACMRVSMHVCFVSVWCVRMYGACVSACVHERVRVCVLHTCDRTVGSVWTAGEGCGWPGWDLVLAAPKGQAGKGTGGKGRSAAWGSAARRAREKGREGQGEEVTGPAGMRRGPRGESGGRGAWKWPWSPGRGEASWTWAADAWPVPRASRPSPVSPRTRHLGESDEAELLGQQGVVAEPHRGPDGLVDGTVAEVQLRRDELQVRGGDHSVDRELHRLDLKCRGPAHSGPTWRLHGRAPR